MSETKEKLPDYSPTVEFLYLDNDLVVVNKPSGMLVHPGRDRENEGKPLMKIIRDDLGQRVYPIHRLDRPVSGPILFLLKPELVEKVQEHWHSHIVIKKYLALVKGNLEQDGSFNEELDQKPSLTHYKVLANFKECCLCEVEIKTGRHHQIRRHFSHAFHPVIGDTTHGKGELNNLFRSQFALTRIFLHSHNLTFPHPITHSQIEIKCPLPFDLKHVLQAMSLEAVSPNDRVNISNILL